MQGKVALVTGAFTGIGDVTSLGLYCAGKHAAEELTKAAAHPWTGSRNQRKWQKLSYSWHPTGLVT